MFIVFIVFIIIGLVIRGFAENWTILSMIEGALMGFLIYIIIIAVFSKSEKDSSKSQEIDVSFLD
ncbi:MAG: hypothetical protein U9Q66_01600 [Patescibacteria group bacterium]|nr:hypothetical protein [Patescibacteria group bacterium]